MWYSVAVSHGALGWGVCQLRFWRGAEIAALALSGVILRVVSAFLHDYDIPSTVYTPEHAPYYALLCEDDCSRIALASDHLQNKNNAQK